MGRMRESVHETHESHALAVTSEHVLEPSSQLQVSVDLRSVDLSPVAKVLSVIRDVAPWLLMFKRNHTEFLLSQTTEHRTTGAAATGLHHSSEEHVSPLQDRSTEKELSERQRTRIKELQQLREDESFRLRFLLRDKDQTFISEFRQKELKEPEMQKCLDDLEECAVKVDRMHRGRLVSGVISSSVGLVGGAASIAAVSGVIRLTTMIADVWEKKHQRIKANTSLQKFEDHMNELQQCLNSSIMVGFERSPLEDQVGQE
ncbi:hypothetical protein WMY93_032645 [Mugilogobius chulae]|uniref:Uncharacterized protein n=1 Tax=Mugilogobius chulae TaxID=88201 RepID=A0AAW0MKQ9_9GOBI